MPFWRPGAVWGLCMRGACWWACLPPYWRRMGRLSLVTLVCPIQYCAPGSIYAVITPNLPYLPLEISLLNHMCVFCGSLFFPGLWPHRDPLSSLLIHTGVIQQQQPNPLQCARFLGAMLMHPVFSQPAWSVHVWWAHVVLSMQQSGRCLVAFHLYFLSGCISHYLSLPHLTTATRAPPSHLELLQGRDVP